MKPIILKQQKHAEWKVGQAALLSCGIMSSALYVFANIICAMRYEGYSSMSQTVSELSAIGVPTRPLWISLMIPYSFLVILFGYGTWRSARDDRNLRVLGILFIVGSIIGAFWPPMHQREVLAAGGGTISDILHIAFTVVWGVFVILQISFGAVALRKGFMIYSIVTLVLLLLFGILTGIQSPGMQTNSPTPWIGVWERINIGVYMLWVAVLAIRLLQNQRENTATTKIS
jgi:hypothetical protein